MTARAQQGGVVVPALLDGSLQPDALILEDSLVQPGLRLFRELLLRELERCAEAG